MARKNEKTNTEGEFKGKKHGTKKMLCKCENEYQDEKYGKMNRIHNIGKEGKSFSCTVCGNTKTFGA